MAHDSEIVGFSQITSGKSKLWRQLLAEFIGTLFIVFIGCGSTISGWTENDTSPSVVRIALAFGLTVAAVVEVTGHVSGGHVNPAVTLAMLVCRRIAIIPAVLFVVVQLLGGIAGAGLLFALSPEEINSPLGLNTINSKLTTAQGFGVEFLITSLLIFTVFSVTDKGRGNDGRGSVSLAIGIAVTVGHLLAIKFTGCGMNPARVFGPAVVTGKWVDHWAYWLGECGGAIVAAILYLALFSAENPLILRLFPSSRGSVNDYNLKSDTVPVTTVTMERIRMSPVVSS